ncbi:MAG: glycosyltransferase family 2 protein [Chloroflexota bacterium]
MYRDHKIALVIPAHNEERLIHPTLEAVPEIVDRVYVVDDASTDNMPQVVLEYKQNDPRVHLIQLPKNRGPGGAIITGYRQAVNDGFDLVVVVGGDNQMPLDQITSFLDPLIEDKADYTKGNRFMAHNHALREIPGNMPKSRLLGNMLISGMTKIASGFYKIADVVDGYTAITHEAILTIDWDRAWKGYGYPMDFLIRLNTYGLRVKDVPRRAIYLPGERQSQIKGLRYALRVSPMLLRGFLWRLVYKYMLWDFHPLVFFFIAGLTLLPTGIAMGIWLVWLQLTGVGVSGPKATFDALLIITGLQFLLFAMLFDMEQGER